MNHKRWLPRMVEWVVVIGLLVACGSPQPTLPSASAPPTATSIPMPTATPEPIPTIPPSEPTETPLPSPTATAPPTQRPGPSYRAQIKISTTSDWTVVRLVGGGDWYDLTVVSASQQALSAGVDGDQLSLSQSIDRAGAGRSVELVADVSLTGLDPEETLLFEVERGHIGSTQVEISSDQDGPPRVITVFTWDGISSGEHNTQAFEVSPEPFLGAKRNEYVVIAQLNFWYYGPGEFGGFEDDHGNRVTPLTPLLGETYWASDPSVVYQQIEWAVEYGVDAFSIEWTTPRGIGCCGSMEDTLDDVFLKSPNIHKVRWVIFYDFVLRLLQTPGLDIDMDPNIDFDQPDVYSTFVSDFVHFAKKYFGHPQYLTIDGRPVIYIWATNSYTGDFAGAMQEARDRVSELGFDVFIVGDEVCVGCFNRDHAALFDGSSTFTFLIPGLDPSWADVGEAAEAVDGAFQWWRAQIEGLRVAGREELVNFQPAWAPQYDDHLFVFDHPTYVPAMSRNQVVEMAKVARKHAQPVGSSGQKFVWLNTWNNWAETTTVEPTADLGPRFPAGNYGFVMLKVVRQVFGRETFYTSPLP